LQTITLYAMFDFVLEIGAVYYGINFCYVCCTFNQIFSVIYVAKMLQTTHADTRKVLKSAAMTVSCPLLEQSVRVKRAGVRVCVCIL
jgi:hypothetical protein